MLILASNSPRRKQLLALSGWEFQVLPVKIDERQNISESPGDYVLRLAIEKANAAALLAPRGSLIIAADTTVVDEDHILGKPVNADEALDLLQRLRNRMHQVFTAVCILDVDTSLRGTDICITNVFMRAYSLEEMSAYVASGDPFDKAGAYAIQHRGFDPVERLEGCYANVVGLPLCHLTQSLQKFNLTPTTDITHRCQESHYQSCSLRDMVLQKE